ncbi:hypothetical protein ABZ348_23540 [Streptomyces sp. NPDC005963]|uniref:hypothetical protein n=1 Tax=Streptomyces sp. NPDC005963 TaxID=3156721 RepID=UPI0034051DE8
MLGLLGFYDELAEGGHQPNGPLSDAVSALGTGDESAVVAYLDAGHCVLDVTEGVVDVLTGIAHRHSGGGSSHCTDGAWLWRKDFSHYLESHHVLLPLPFLHRVRGLSYRMQPLVCADFGPRYDSVAARIGWPVAPAWRSRTAVLEPPADRAMSKAEYDEVMRERTRQRPSGRWATPRKPRGRRSNSG